MHLKESNKRGPSLLSPLVQVQHHHSHLRPSHNERLERESCCFTCSPFSILFFMPIGIFRLFCPWCIVALKYIEYGVYGDLMIIYPKPYSIYSRGTIEEASLKVDVSISCESLKHLGMRRISGTQRPMSQIT